MEAFNMSVGLIDVRQTLGGPEKVSYTYLVLWSILGLGTLVKNKEDGAKRLPTGLLSANDIFYIPHAFSGLVDLMSDRSQDGLGATRLIKSPRPDSETAWGLSVFTVGGVSRVTAGQVSTHIPSAGQSDKACKGKIDLWPNSAKFNVENQGLKFYDSSLFLLC